MFDLERRTPVWQAMSELFLDTDLSRERKRAIAMMLETSGYSQAELRIIYEREVAPVCYDSLLQADGAWGYLEGGGLEQAIVRHLRQRQSYPNWWPFGRGRSKLGVEMTRREFSEVMRMVRRLRRDPEQLGRVLLRCADESTLVRALDDLALIGPRAGAAAAAILHVSGHCDFRVRAAAVEAAQRVMEQEALGEVIGRLDDASPTVRSAAISALHELIDRMVDAHPEGADGSVVATPADHNLERIARDGLDGVRRHLRDGKSCDRMHAARILQRLGRRARPAVRDVFDAFGDRNEAVRRAVSKAVVAMDPDHEETLAHLKRSLFETSPRVRQTAALCLAEFTACGDPRYDAALKVLRAALADSSTLVRQGAAVAVGWMGPAAADSVPRLVELTRASEVSVRASALFALGKMEDAALCELPTLTASLEDDHPEVRRAALRALRELGSLVSALEPRIKAMLTDPDWLTQFEAQRALQAVRHRRG